MRLATVALVLVAGLVAQTATGQQQMAVPEQLAIAPGHTLRFHPAATPERPGSARYRIALEAGDWLAVTAPAAIVDGAATEPELRLTGPKGEQARDHGRLVWHAVSSGNWVLEAHDFHALSISRYPAGHPVVDPGQAPQDVRLEAGDLGKVAMAMEPMEPRYDDAPPPSGWPARLAIGVGERMTIHLYRRAALRQIELWPHDPTRNLAALLEGDVPIEAGLYLPMFPLGESALVFAARAERVRGACFSYLRYVGHWAQEDAYPFDELTYTALGLSRDGQWFAVVTAGMAPAGVQGQPATVQDGKSTEYEAALAQAIATDPRAVTPSVAQLDTVIASLSPPCAER